MITPISSDDDDLVCVLRKIIHHNHEKTRIMSLQLFMEKILFFWSYSPLKQWKQVVSSTWTHTYEQFVWRQGAPCVSHMNKRDTEAEISAAHATHIYLLVCVAYFPLINFPFQHNDRISVVMMIAIIGIKTCIYDLFLKCFGIQLYYIMMTLTTCDKHQIAWQTEYSFTLLIRWFFCRCVQCTCIHYCCCWYYAAFYLHWKFKWIQWKRNHYSTTFVLFLTPITSASALYSLCLRLQIIVYMLNKCKILWYRIRNVIASQMWMIIMNTFNLLFSFFQKKSPFLFRQIFFFFCKKKVTISSFEYGILI